MSLNEILNTEVGFIFAIIATWVASIWFYKENKKEHDELGEMVKTETQVLSASIDRLSDKIDGVRDAISHHESIWHAPEVLKIPKTKARPKKSAVKKR